MNTHKNSHVRSRVLIEQKFKKNDENESNMFLTKTTTELKKTVFTSITTRRSNENAKRPRILSDTAVSAMKKLETNPNLVEGIRAPLADINKNICDNATQLSRENNIRKSVRIETLRLLKDNKTTHLQNRVEQTKDSRIIYNCEVENQKIIYHSNYTSKLTDYQKSNTNAFLKHSVVDNKTIPSVRKNIRTTFLNDEDIHTAQNKNEAHLLDDVFNTNLDAQNDLSSVIDNTTSRLLEQVSSRHKCLPLFQTNNNISPICSSKYLRNTSLIFQGIPYDVKQPGRKTTLLQRRKPGLTAGNSEAGCLNIYDKEYLEDIVQIQLKNDPKYILQMDLLEFHNKNGIERRCAVVNWLIQAQDYLSLPLSALLSTIYLYDRVLTNTSVATNMCQLVAITILWIVNKYNDTTNKFLCGSKLLPLCKNVYSLDQLLRMEKKLLAFYNFDVHLPDLTIYIAYYLNQLNLKKDVILYSAYYVLECYALNVNFSVTKAAVKAAAAVCLSLRILYPIKNMWCRLEKIMGYYSEEELNNVMNEMLVQLQKVNDPAHRYRQPFQKYAIKDKLEVSLILLHKLVAT